jgi:glycosyltransferase involved in cell wall biosynthesis
MPDFVDYLIVVNDGSSDRTASIVSSKVSERVIFIDRAENKGLGYTLSQANVRALGMDADIMVIMAGDGQMLPEHLPQLLDALIDKGYDFAKGNRFSESSSLATMPPHRVFGNIALTFLTKIATGYWSIFDPQNGYTAMMRSMSEQIDWGSIATNYSYENDVLSRLALNHARIKDVSIPAYYGDETSTVKLSRTIPHLLVTLWRSFWKRIWINYVVQSFSPIVLFGFLGIVLLVFGIGFGAWSIWQVMGIAPMSSAKAVLTAITTMTGIQFLLVALVLDIINEPK